MRSPVVQARLNDWRVANADPAWLRVVEGGGVLYFPQLTFDVQGAERSLLRPDMLARGTRNVSLGADGTLKGAAGTAEERQALAQMVGRFRQQALQLVDGLAPHYRGKTRVAPTSFRPLQVQTRAQSVRADDQRLHVDAFPSRPNRGERILRVFSNIHPHGEPRVWRIGDSFEATARHFWPQLKPYRPWQARWLQRLHVTKSLRSEYDHLMLQLHDRMKFDTAYQQACPQTTMPFAAGSTWVCFSDQATHAVMGGQYMLEQTLHLPPGCESDPASSPLAILTRLMGRPLLHAPCVA